MASYEVDKNMLICDVIGEEDVVLYAVRHDPFDVYGLYNYRNEPVFKRLPDEIGKNVNNGVAKLYLNTAGGRVRFATDSLYVAISAKMPQISHMPHMPLFGSAGFDLYLDDPETGDSRYFETFKPKVGFKEGYEFKIKFRDRKLRYLTINFPSYSDVASLHVGLQKDAVVDHGLKYRDVAPIVYYGSSITQGGCSSRPGNAFANIVSRRTNTDFINLGFSGSGCGEELIARYMAELDMSVFIADYDHNAPSAEHLATTGERMYRIIREKHPTLPYLFISRPDFNTRWYDDNLKRRDSVYDVYRKAVAEGDKNVYFIDGSSIFRGDESDMATVDGTHPNDYGFYLMAKAVESELFWIWRSKNIR